MYVHGYFKFAIDRFEYVVGDKVILVDADAKIEYGKDYEGDSTWDFASLEINYAEDDYGNTIKFTPDQEKQVSEVIMKNFYTNDWPSISEIMDLGY